MADTVIVTVPPAAATDGVDGTIASLVEHDATLKVWKILTRLRCSPHRATAIVWAILVLHHVENPPYVG